MEIADIFVVNKADRDGANQLVKSLSSLLQFQMYENSWEPTIVKTIASQNKGIKELVRDINKHEGQIDSEKRSLLLAQKAYQILQSNLMQHMQFQQNEFQKLCKFVTENITNVQNPSTELSDNREYEFKPHTDNTGQWENISEIEKTNIELEEQLQQESSSRLTEQSELFANKQKPRQLWKQVLTEQL